MADTPKGLAALQLLLQDNITGEINAQDIRDFLVSVYGRWYSVTKTSSDSTYAVGNDDVVIDYNATGGASEVDLPTGDAHNDRVLFIYKSDASANTVTINRGGSDTIEGAASAVLINQNEGFLLVKVGTIWQKVATTGVYDDLFGALEEPNGFPNRTDSVISFVDGTLTFTIAPASGSFSYYIDGKKYTKSGSDDKIITDVEGIHFIYYDGETLTESTSPPSTIFNGSALITVLYWDATNKAAINFLEERHGTIMSGKTHEYLHKTVGTRFESGLTIGDYLISQDGSLNTHAQMSFTDGIIWDEDIDVNITNDATPSNDFEQILSTVAEIPVYYRSGASGVWRKDIATTYPLKQGTLRIKYNLPAGPWTTPDVTTNDYFTATWIFATSSKTEPVIAILGQREDTNLTDAQNNNNFEDLVFGSMPSTEMKFLYRLIFKTSSAYGNTPKAALFDILDARASSTLAGQNQIPSDHNALSLRNASNAHPSSSVENDVSSFGNVLTASDTNVQLALDTMDDAFRNPSYTVTVAKSGGDFTSIQSAIDSITVGAGERYVVRIYPGIYAETVTTKDGVHLQGEGPSPAVVIAGSTGTLLTMGTGTSYAAGITLSFTGTGATPGSLLSCTSGVHILNNCSLDYNISNGYGSAVNVSGGVFFLNSSVGTYDGTGTGDGAHNFLNFSGTCSPIIANSSITVDVASTTVNTYILAFYSTRTGTSELLVASNVIHVTASGASFLGHVETMKIASTGNFNFFRTNHIIVFTPSGAGSSLAACYDLDNASTELRSNGNSIHVSGAVNNYFAEGVSGAIFNTHFDDVVSENWLAGAMTPHIVSSNADGDLTVTGVLNDINDNNISVTTLVTGATNIWPMHSGSWYDNGTHGDAIDATSTEGFTEDVLRAVRFRVTRTATMDRIAVEKTAGSGNGSLLRLGVYDDDNNRPGALRFDAGEVAFDTSTVKEITISQELVPGTYWLAAVHSLYTRTYRAFLRGEGLSIGYATSATTTKALFLERAFTYAALPDPFGGTPTLNITEKPPRILLRRA